MRSAANEVHATLRGELFGILEFVKGREGQRIGEFMPAVVANPGKELHWPEVVKWQTAAT